uniref:Transglutaminase-like domain-containing protein n=1 Tax=Dicentrarchus labrax TaxID=13489 RepID=A0A8C4DK63_DICLA
WEGGLVNFEAEENHTSHETLGLSKKHLVVRRGKPFSVTLLFYNNWWNGYTENLVLEVSLGMEDRIQSKMPVQFCDKPSDPHCWSSVTINICSPVLSSVGVYCLWVHIQTAQNRRTYALGDFVLLCNPWHKDDPVYIPLDAHIEEYIKSDYGLVYMGTPLNISGKPWSFGQYEPGVLEACLKLLQVSPEHLSDKQNDYIQRANPVYLSRVICAMVNSNDDLGILEGKWHGNYKGGIKPTDWSGSADILHRWVSSNCKPVRYGQCWVYASVLCTVMRVLGIPSRVVTVFNAAHDGDGSVKIEEIYSSTGEKLNLSKDSIWNFHVWVECWMRRPDLGPGFDGWQVVDPTPQEKSAGKFCCGPCPVVAIQQRCLHVPYDSSFVYASVDADIIRLIVHDGLVVQRVVDTESVGQLIYTKGIGSDRPNNLTQTYKSKTILSFSSPEKMLPGLEVSLHTEKIPSVGDNIIMCVTVTNCSNTDRILMEHVNAQLKEYNCSPQESFWRTKKEVHIQQGKVLTLHHTISPSEYESYLGADDIVNVAVVIEDLRTKERFLAAQEFSISSPPISIEMKEEHTVHVSFINTFSTALNGAMLTVEGFGLLQDKQNVSSMKHNVVTFKCGQVTTGLLHIHAMIPLLFL